MVNPNKEVTASLFEENMGLVISISKQFKPKNDNEFDEFVQLGRIGLWKAIKAYDKSRGKLSTLAWYYIRWEIMKYINQEKKERVNVKNDIDIPSIDKDILWEYLPSTLSDLESKIINLHLDGYSFIDIGEKTGFSKTWVHSIYHKALKKISDANK